MKNHINTSDNAFQHKRHHKDTKTQALNAFILEQPYIDIKEQAKICEQFGLPPLRKVFQDIYRYRFYQYVFNHTTTAATVERETGIPQKYLTCCKLHYEKKGLLKVVGIGICPTTGSRNVQFISSNPVQWSNGYFYPDSNQTKLEFK